MRGFFSAAQSSTVDSSSQQPAKEVKRRSVVLSDIVFGNHVLVNGS
jgi:hypothetical protein